MNKIDEKTSKLGNRKLRYSAQGSRAVSNSSK